MRPIMLAALIPLLLAGCGKSTLEGEYGFHIGSEWVTAFTFKGKEVDVHMPFGPAVRGTYRLEEGGKKIAITLNNETSVFTFDEAGCIQAGTIFGLTVCQKGK